MRNQGFLTGVFRAAIDAVRPDTLVRRSLARDGRGVAVVSNRRTVARLSHRIWLIAAGKAAGGMAAAACDAIGDAVAGGVVVAPRKVRGLPGRVLALAGNHPVPGPGSLEAGRAVWRLLGRAREDDAVLVCLSGGASSLLVLPAAGIALADKIHTTRLLLASGATIAGINAVRKHLSRLKGGGLARRAGGARVVTLLLSDVIGSSPSVIGSGPAAPDPTTFWDAHDVLRRHGLLRRVPVAVRRRLEQGRRGLVDETPGPGELRSRHVLLADVRLALQAAAQEASRRGATARILTASLRGDTRRAARRLAAIARACRPSRRPLCLLAGGETTVEVHGRGRGGRNQELALEFARHVEGWRIGLLSAGTDGLDGPTDAAGAFADGSTVARARRAGLDPRRALDENDSWTFFDRLGDLFRTGPTGTNVMDLKIVLIEPSPRRPGRAESRPS